MTTPDKLFKELVGIIEHPRAEEILLGYWLYDEKLPIPSIDVIRLIGAVALDNQNFADAVDHQVEQGGDAEEDAVLSDQKSAKILVQMLRDMPLEGVRDDMPGMLVYQKVEDLEKPDRGGEWSDLLVDFLQPSTPHKRIAARKVMEALFSRALFHCDSDALRALANLLEVYGKDELPFVFKARKIAAEIVWYVPRLLKRLDRMPSKSETQKFLEDTGMVPETDPKTWAKAFKIAGFGQDGDRKAKRNFDEISAIIKECRTK